MPTKTFYNLPKEKQDKLINSALNEFSRTSFYDASINNIINEASISRGSFYMYFTDKEDLFKYLLFSHKKYIEDTILNNLDLYNGNLKQTFIKSYDEGVRYKNIRNCKDFLNNVFSNLNINNEEFLISKDIILEKVKDKIDISDLKKDIDINEVLGLLINNMLVSLGMSVYEQNINLSREKYLKRLDIICYGIYEEDKND